MAVSNLRDTVASVTLKAQVKRELARIPGAVSVARLTIETIRVCLRYRVTGLASEAGFFALLSLPPLVLGLFGGVGYVGQWLGQATVDQITGGIQTWAERFLTDTTVKELLVPTVDDVLGTGRFDLISVGFLLSIWSGSRALNVFVDTISIMYGQSGVRGIVRTRALSLTLYFLSIVVGIVVIPLVVIGPTWLDQLLPEELHYLTWLYWPVVTFLAVASLATLYHISTPRRTPWLRDVPGAVLTLVIWLLASFVLRGTLSASLLGKSTSIYGPLSTPIVLLIWLYFLAIAVLIGAALNAAIRKMWPVEERPSFRAKAHDWLRREAGRRRGSVVVDVLGTGPFDDAPKGARGPSQPLTPNPEKVPRRPGSKAREKAPEKALREVDKRRFGDGEEDRIMSVRTRSG